MSVLYPDVPDMAGVPTVLRTTASIAASITDLRSISASITGIAYDISPLSGSIAAQLGAATSLIDSAAAIMSGNRDASAILSAATGLYPVASALRGLGVMTGPLDAVLSTQITGQAISLGKTSASIAAQAEKNIPEKSAATSPGKDAPKFEWGIYKDGSAFLVPDNIVAVEYGSENRIADYPVEGGTIVSYDKVKMPSSVFVTVTKGGSISDKSEFLDKLDLMRTDLDVYEIVTPEQTFTNMNITGIKISRSADRGATLIIAEIAFREVMQTLNRSYSNTRDAASASPVSNGAAQSTATTPQGDGVQ